MLVRILIHVCPVGQMNTNFYLQCRAQGLDNVMDVCEDPWVMNFSFKVAYILIPWAFNKVHADTEKAFPMINYAHFTHYF